MINGGRGVFGVGYVIQYKNDGGGSRMEKLFVEVLGMIVYID